MQKHLEISAVIGFSGNSWSIQVISMMACSFILITSILYIHLEQQWLSDTSSQEPKLSSKAITTAFPVPIPLFSNQNIKRRSIHSFRITIITRSSC